MVRAALEAHGKKAEPEDDRGEGSVFMTRSNWPVRRCPAPSRASAGAYVRASEVG